MKYYNDLLEKTKQALSHLKKILPLIRNETDKTAISLSLVGIEGAYGIVGVNVHDKFFKKIKKKIKDATPVALLHYRDDVVKIIEKDIPEFEGIISRYEERLKDLTKKPKVTVASSIMTNALKEVR